MKSLTYVKNNLLGADNNMHLTVDSLVLTNNIITGSNNNTLRKVNAKSHGYDKLYMDKDLIQDKLYGLIDQFNERKNFILHYSTIYIRFMMGMGEPLR